MAEEQPPTRKVVKRVVKKTVVRPPSSAGTTAPTRTVARPAAKAKAPSKNAPPTTPKAGRPSVPRVDVGRGLDAVRSAGSRGGSATRRAGYAVADATADAFGAARAWRLPHLPPYRAAVLTGVLVGLLVVALGGASLLLFSEVRGVASGGGRWGGLVLVVITVVGGLAARQLLRAFGSPHPGITSSLAVVLTIVAILGLFLDLADSGAAWLLIPALAAVSLAVSHWLIDLAESTPAPIE